MESAVQDFWEEENINELIQHCILHATIITTKERYIYYVIVATMLTGVTNYSLDYIGGLCHWR